MPSANANIGIDPDALLAVRDLELRIQVVAKGLWSGLHRSPFHGFSVEFSQYRQYSPGDDLRYLDWKALARTDRLYLKRNEDETNLRCLLLLDSSRSMAFTSGKFPKFEYARTFAATFAYFMLQQRDMAGFAAFDDDFRSYVPPRWRVGQFRRILTSIPEAATGVATNLAKALQQAAHLTRHRSLIVIVSDFLDPTETWLPQLKELKAFGHDVRVAQILDPAELSLEYAHAAYWHDLESDSRIHIDPNKERAGYLRKFVEHQNRFQSQLRELGVPMRGFDTSTPLDVALHEFIEAKNAVAPQPEGSKTA